MGSPKELQKLQLSKPDTVNEGTSLRSPISSRIWQAEDPTHRLGFTGEDVSMRNFCASVHGDNELAGSFSFDTDSEAFLGAQRDASVGVLCTLPVPEVQEHHMSLQQHDSKTDLKWSENPESQSYSERSPEDSTFTASQSKDVTHADLKSAKNVIEHEKSDLSTTGHSSTSAIFDSKTSYSENIHHEPVLAREDLSSDLKTEKLNTETDTAENKAELHMRETGYASCMPPVSETSNVHGEKAYPNNTDTTLNANKVMHPESQNVSGGALPESSLQDINPSIQYTKMTHGKSDFQDFGNAPVDEIKSGSTTDGSISCRKTSNGGFSTKTKSELVNPSNDISTQSDKVEYRSIAISPIVPPGSTTNFTFHSTMEAKGPLSTISATKVFIAAKEFTNKDDLSKTSSFELAHSGQDDGTDSKVRYRSIAVSPIIPPVGEESFTFQTDSRSLTVKSLQCHGAEHTTGSKSIDSVPKTYSFELTPPNADVGTETRVECKSAAVSPIIPSDGSSFTFQTLKSTFSTRSGLQTQQSGDTLSNTNSFELTPYNQDVWTQADTRAECVSVAVSPIIPPDASSSFTFHAEQRHQVMYRAEEKEPTAESMNPQNQTSTPEKQNQNVGTRSHCVSVALSPFAPQDNVSSFTFHTQQTAQPAGEKSEKDAKNTKTYSFELTPPDEDAGKDIKVEYRSIAVSPIVPPGSPSFTFQTEKENVLPKTYSFELTPPDEPTGTHAGNKVECVSVAVSPIILPSESSTFTFHSNQSALETEAHLAGTSLQFKPPSQDVGIQVDISALCTSIAISPIVPLDGASSFLFQSEATSQGAPDSACSHEKPPMMDAEMQVSFSVETKSVATDPMTPIGKSPCTSYPEVHVKESKGDHPEPVREVSWDEKGMTWEVYGASMEVEVLGMAIQKHLEKQIEEHGRQKVMTPQNTRGSSIRGTTEKVEPKRQPNAFRSFFHGVRRPRCCSRAAPSVE